MENAYKLLITILELKCYQFLWLHTYIVQFNRNTIVSNQNWCVHCKYMIYGKYIGFFYW